MLTPELIESVDALSSESHFFVVLFSTEPVVAPRQKGWITASQESKTQLRAWIENWRPSGGTTTSSMFNPVFELEPPPGVIFFVTDGEIPRDTFDVIAKLNKDSQLAKINVIVMGEPSNEHEFRAVAEQSGGEYRRIPILSW